MNWIQLIKEVGPYLGIMFFFVWRDYRREENLVKQNVSLNKFIRKELMDLIERTTEVISDAKR